MLNPDATLALAERVAAAARDLGIETALIGAAALSVHGYTRGTQDLDFAVLVDPHTQLRALRDALAASGLNCELRLPDDDDPLGGMLVIRATGAEDPERVDVVEVVNFGPASRAARSPAQHAIQRAEPVAGTTLRCVTLEDLVAFKLYAGGWPDFADIQQLLARNPGLDIALLRAVAAPFDRDGKLEALVASAQDLRGGQPSLTRGSR
jgi:hypothetical protein